MRWLDRWFGWFRDPDPQGRVFDDAWGTDTSWFDLGNYEPTPVGIVDAALDTVPADPREHTFVDLGSGKGRVVLLASRRPFRAVVGIEHRSALHEVALDNRARFASESRCPVLLLCGDAALAPLPAGPLVVWLFNPFGAEVLAAFLGHLSRRHAMWIVYVVPRELPVVQAHGFTPVSEGGPSDCRWTVLYRAAEPAP